MNKLIYKYFLFIFICLFVLSCSKEDDSRKGPNCGVPSLKSISPGLSQLEFKTGTYWTFIDSVSLVKDSTYIYSDTHVTVGNQYCPDNKTEVFSFKTISSVTAGDNEYSIVGNYISRNQQSEGQANANIFIDYNLPIVTIQYIYYIAHCTK